MSYSWSVCHCKDCVCMDLNDRSRYDPNKAWCSERRQYYNPNEPACSTYFKYDESRSSVSGGCYLTTICCHILEMQDNVNYLQILRNFRDNYMLNRPELYITLIEYEVVGPKIANAIMEDPLKKELAKKILENSIIPITKDIQEKNYTVAIQKYEYMTNTLKNYYNIDNTITKKLDINVKTLGKARA